MYCLMMAELQAETCSRIFYIYIYVCVCACVCGWMDGWMDGWKVGCCFWPLLLALFSLQQKGDESPQDYSPLVRESVWSYGRSLSCKPKCPVKISRVFFQGPFATKYCNYH